MEQDVYQKDNMDEIDLMDYIKVILKRKKIIFGITILAVIAAAGFSFSMAKVYKIDSSLEIGKIAGEVIEGPLQVVEKIKADSYGVLIREKLNLSEEEYPKIKAENPKDTNLVRIEIESNKPKMAKTILEELNDLILKEHQERLDNRKSKIEENINEIQAELNLLETKKQYSEGIAELQIELVGLKNQMNTAQLTKIVKKPTISEEPIKPRPLLNIVIAGVLGLFIGTFLAFFKEWWEKSKNLA